MYLDEETLIDMLKVIDYIKAFYNISKKDSSLAILPLSEQNKSFVAFNENIEDTTVNNPLENLLVEFFIDEPKFNMQIYNELSVGDCINLGLAPFIEDKLCSEEIILYKDEECEELIYELDESMSEIQISDIVACVFSFPEIKQYTDLLNKMKLEYYDDTNLCRYLKNISFYNNKIGDSYVNMTILNGKEFVFATISDYSDFSNFVEQINNIRECMRKALNSNLYLIYADYMMINYYALVNKKIKIVLLNKNIYKYKYLYRRKEDREILKERTITLRRV